MRAALLWYSNHGMHDFLECTHTALSPLGTLLSPRQPHPRNFRFASYLKKCEQSVVLNLAGIKEGVWVALILLVGAELFVKGLFGEAKSNEV